MTTNHHIPVSIVTVTLRVTIPITQRVMTTNHHIPVSIVAVTLRVTIPHHAARDDYNCQTRVTRSVRRAGCRG